MNDLRDSFSFEQRKAFPSLKSLAISAVKAWIIDCLDDRTDTLVEISDARKYIREQTMPAMREEILSSLMPFDEGMNSWIYGCLQANRRMSCKLHTECIQLYNHCSRLVKFLFSCDMESLKIDFKKVSLANLEPSLRNLNRIIRVSHYCRLKELTLAGNLLPMSEYLLFFEDLCSNLLSKAHLLSKLHLPAGSNNCVMSCSRMPRLSSLHIERTCQFNYKGLKYLCDPQSSSKFCLQSLHLGVSKRSCIRKLDLAEFLVQMASLSNFCLEHQDRPLIAMNVDKAERIMTYSALKLAIVQSVYKNGCEFISHLKEIKVVDKSLNPEYVLQHCPEVQKLSIDWQEELSQVPFNHFHTDWFSKTIRNPDWSQLCATLTNLELIFPAFYNRDAYNCPVEDFAVLLQGSFASLTSLTLKGMIHDFMFVQIQDILASAPRLEDLKIDQCTIGFFHNYSISPTHKSSLKNLHWINSVRPFMLPSNFVEGIVNLMPNLVKLVIRPPNTEYQGFLLSQLRCLTALPYLECLEIPVATSDCVNNMPGMVYILREFPSLAYLTLIWGRFTSANTGRVRRMTDWLENALKADNANIHVQMSYLFHPFAYGL